MFLRLELILTLLHEPLDNGKGEIILFFRFDNRWSVPREKAPIEFDVDMAACSARPVIRAHRAFRDV